MSYKQIQEAAKGLVIWYIYSKCSKYVEIAEEFGDLQLIYVDDLHYEDYKYFSLEELVSEKYLGKEVIKELIQPVLKLYGIFVDGEELWYQDNISPTISVNTRLQWDDVNNLFTFDNYNNIMVFDKRGHGYMYRYFGISRYVPLFSVEYYSLLLLLIDPIRYYKKYNKLVRNNSQANIMEYELISQRIRVKSDIYERYLLLWNIIMESVCVSDLVVYVLGHLIGCYIEERN